MTFQGLLNTKCNIEITTKSQDASKQMIDAWSVQYANVKCRIDGATGEVFLGENKQVNYATHILFIEKKYNIDMHKNRIKMGSNIYNILQITDGGGHGHHFEIFLEKRN